LSRKGCKSLAVFFFKEFAMTATSQRTILTYGTFDLFHPGHVALLRRAKEMGTRLVVGLSTDEFNAIKGKQSVMGYEDRKAVLESCRYVDLVIPESHWDQKPDDAVRHQADVFVMGDDWAGKFDFMSDQCHVVYLSRTPGVSSTEIKAKMRGEPARTAYTAALPLA
jgi:glycerol-3-phosphate cytidylyltransferase